MSIDYDVRDGVAWITLNRPKKLNALDLEDWHNLASSLDAARADTDGPVVLTGAGRVFCAGDDIQTFLQYDDPDAATEFFIGGLFAAMQAIVNYPYPVIAAVNGSAFGGGVELILACDLAIAVSEARFSLPEGRVGAWPTVQTGLAFYSMCGRKRANEMAFEMSDVDAQTAADWGLINRIVPADELESEAMATVARINAAPKHSVRMVKRFLSEELTLFGLPKAKRALTTLAEQTMLSPDMKEGAVAFLEKRAPRFGGRK